MCKCSWPGTQAIVPAPAVAVGVAHRGLCSLCCSAGPAAPTHLEDAHALLHVGEEVIEAVLEALEVVVVDVGGGVDGPVNLGGRDTNVWLWERDKA